MTDYDKDKGANPADVRAAVKGWAIFTAITVTVFGIAYAWREM